MKIHKLAIALLGLAMLLGNHSMVKGQVFFTDSFDYADGDLATVSGGLWVGHSGAAPDIQVVAGDAVVTAPGSMDDHRQTGAVMGLNDTWYYAVRFSVELPDGAQGVNNDYFIHLKDSTAFGFNARLATAAPIADGDFSLEIWASSGGDGKAPWTSDFLYGEEIIAVVEWNNGTGVATLWVNPVDINSPSVADDELPDAMRAIEALALRQDNTNGSIVTIPVVSVGESFADVLDEVTPTGGPVTVTPDSIITTRGNYISGGVAEISASDNADYRISRANADIQSRTEFEVKAVSPVEMPIRFEVTLECAVFARSNVVQSISLYDYVLGAYELVDARNAARSPAPDLTIIVTPPGDLSRFVEPGTRCVEARVLFRSDSPRQNFTSNTDFFSWTIE